MSDLSVDTITPVSGSTVTIDADLVVTGSSPGGGGSGLVEFNPSINDGNTSAITSVAGKYIVMVSGEERKGCDVWFDGTNADIVALTTEATNTYGNSIGESNINIYVDSGDLTIENQSGGPVTMKIRGIQ